MSIIKAILSSNAGRALINGLILTAVGLWGYYQAYDKGYQAAQVDQHKTANQTLNAQLVDLTEQIKTANLTSILIGQKIDEYKNQGEKSSDELRKTLAKTRANRVQCVFDTDSMRQLADARARAILAAAGGIDNALSGTAGTAGK